MEEQQKKDLSFLWPVIDRIKAVEIKFDGDAAPEVARALNADGSGGTAANLEARVARLEAEIASIKEVVQSAASAVAAGGRFDAADHAAPEDYPRHSWNAIVGAIVVSIVTLMLAHYLIVIVYDLRLIVLRLASIGIPLAVAICFTAKRHIVLRHEITIAFAVAVAAVLGMSYVTSIVEKTSWLPENAREWHETIEYVASIAFAYITGVLASSAWQAHSGRTSGRVGETTLKVAQQVARVTGQALETGHKVGKQVKTIQDVINTAIPAATAIVSVITGVNSVLK